jgi:hypothetical protein
MASSRVARLVPPSIVVLAGVVLSACGDGAVASGRAAVQVVRVTAASEGPHAGVPAGASSPAEQVQVPPPPLSEGIFPCSDCHAEPDLPPNRTRRVLEDAHDEIALRHDEDQRWCLDCHDTTDRDQLHLASGELVPFAESYRVCGQCHGEKYRDWRAGVHGRRTGEWNGAKEYLLCVHCHDPHAPRFKAIAPEPAPVRPSRIAR